MSDPIPIEDVQRRLLTACRTLRALPDRERGLFVIRNSWPAIIREVSEGYGYDTVRNPRWQPTPHDVSDCLTALAWARGLERHEFRLIWWRSYGASFRQIGWNMVPARSDETARRNYGRAVMLCWHNANNTSARQHVAPVAMVRQIQLNPKLRASGQP